MSESRRNLIKRLRTASYETPYFLHVAQKKSQIQWHLPTLNLTAKSSRAFDVFHRLDLAPEEFVKEMAASFARLPKIAKENIEDMQLTMASDRKYVEKWAKRIVQYACSALLEKDGSLNETLLTYLKWNNIPACFIRDRIHEIVTSYINVVLIANIFVAIGKAKQNSFFKISSVFKELITGQRTEGECKLSDEEIAKLAFISKNAIKLVKKEISKNYNVGSLEEIENQAACFANTLPTQDLSSKLLAKENELLELIRINKINSKEKLSFWLEVMLRISENSAIFLSIWKIFKNNPHSDLMALGKYQQEQLYFCQRYAASLSKNESTTKEVIQALVTTKEMPEEVKTVELPVSKKPQQVEQVEIQQAIIEINSPKEVVDIKPTPVMEQKEVDEAKTEEVEDYEFISLYGPSIQYNVSPFTLFRATVFGIAEDVGQRFSYGA
ncbi:MAG: hypothetical protein ACYCQI_08225 [Gammaproteobacteria bacterium]